MFTVNIQWNDETFPHRSVYSCEKYVVSEPLPDGNLALYLDDDKYHILLDGSAVAFVTNLNGKTVDVIRVPR